FVVILFFVAIEVLVRIIFPANGVDHMIDLGPINLFSKQLINGETWYRISNKNAYSDRNILFKEKKEKDQLRIICLGGSASAGWPHPAEETYSRYLEKVLQNVYPSKKIEVINCSAHGFASYRIRQVFETIIPFEPDAVIVWCGNNEFLERRNYKTSEIKNTLIKFRNNFRSLQLVRQLFVEPRYNDTPEVTDTFWKKINEEALELRSDSAQYTKVKEHYEKSMADIIAQASQNNIRLLLMTVPVNLRDWEPNVSHLGTKKEDSLKWLEAFNEGKKDYLTSNYAEAITAFKRANNIAPLHAETLFWLAKACQGVNDTIAAVDYYIRAKDQDYNPFRAISDFNNTLRTLARDHSEVTLLDIEYKMNSYAYKGIPGFDMFLDYVHPTRLGNLVITCEVANQILNTDLLSTGINPNILSLDEIQEINHSDYRDEADPQLQLTRFSLCCITHQYYSALHFARTIKAGIPEEAAASDRSGTIELLNDAIDVFQAYVDFEKKTLTQNPTLEDEKKVQEDIKAFYQKHFPYGVF
ncbi:MAG TPA: SGNH/GDSL hydrolase family protein, partial [Chryseolinea sp.]|nr:SGNH/GDSL hydrolase family protein [Chryseolinea sp.]